MTNRPFENQVVFITGASSGIGEALALELARQGAHLALAARREDRLAEVVGKIESLGGRALAVRCDVTRDGDLDSAIARTVEKFGKIDVAFANAGFGVAGTFENLTLEDYRRQFETNVFGLIRTAKAAFPELKKTHGRLALMSSVAGHVALPGASAYSMSKFSVRALGDALRYELQPDGVAVTVISPGFVSSEFRQVDNLGAMHAEAPDPIPTWIRVSAEEAARDIARAIWKRKAEEVITGHGKVIVWFQRHFPVIINFAKSRGLRSRPEPAKQ